MWLLTIKHYVLIMYLYTRRGSWHGHRIPMIYGLIIFICCTPELYARKKKIIIIPNSIRMPTRHTSIE